MSEPVKLSRTLEAWALVDPLFVMRRVASGETSGAAAYYLLKDAVEDIQALEQRCRGLTVENDQLRRVVATFESGYAYDQLRGEVEVLRSQVATLQSDANSWQSGYDKGRRDGDRRAREERNSLRAAITVARDKPVPPLKHGHPALTEQAAADVLTMLEAAL